MAHRYFQHRARVNQWGIWVFPTMTGRYKIACCGCDLVHNLEFQAIKVTAKDGASFRYQDLRQDRYRVKFRARTNTAETKRLRQPPMDFRPNDMPMPLHRFPGPLITRPPRVPQRGRRRHLNGACLRATPLASLAMNKDKRGRRLHPLP